MRRSFLKAVVGSTLVGVLMGGTGLVQAQQGPSPTERAVVGAKTKADHEKIAVAYDKAAAASKAEAEKHRKLASFYHGLPTGRGEGGHGMASHCENLASLHEKAAEDNAELAKAHRAIASELQ